MFTGRMDLCPEAVYSSTAPAQSLREFPTAKEFLMKYLIMEDFSGQPVPFIFPRRVDHADMRDQLPYGTTLSGGYVELNDGAVRCHGGNAELGIKACPDDADIISESLRKR